VAAIMDAGLLVSDDIVNALIDEQLSAHKGAAGFIFDGYPRTLAQARALDALLATHGQQIDLVLRLVVDADGLIARVAKRFAEEGRADDNPEAFKVRLQAYFDQTAPLVAYYEEQGKVAGIDGMAGIDTVAADIKAALGPAH
jgi:adenylate kinase